MNKVPPCFAASRSNGLGVAEQQDVLYELVGNGVDGASVGQVLVVLHPPRFAQRVNEVISGSTQE